MQFNDPVHKIATALCDVGCKALDLSGCSCKGRRPCERMMREAEFAMRHGMAVPPERDIEMERAYACYVGWCAPLNMKPEPYHNFVSSIVYADGWKAAAAAVLNFKPE